MIKLLADDANHIYTETLYAINEGCVTKNEQVKTLKKSKVVVLFKHQNKNMPANEYDLLVKMLEACKLSVNEVGLINQQYHDCTSFLAIKEQTNARIIISFGIIAPKMNLSIHLPAYTITTFADVQLLLAHPLASIAKDKTKKIALWQKLKLLFTL
jgi:hypothetical protein